MRLVGEATILVNNLLKSDTKPNVIVHTIFRLVRCWNEYGVQDSKSMIELGYEPNVRTWTVILHGVSQQNAMDDAMHLVETMSAQAMRNRMWPEHTGLWLV